VFDSLKAALMSSKVMHFADETKPFILETDCSDYAMGAVLSQYFTGNLHPVAYYSKMLIPAEINYPIHDKELLAIIRALREWKVYLKEMVKPVTVYTDHKSLEYFMTTKELNR
jgi:hypothetical protein